MGWGMETDKIAREAVSFVLRKRNRVRKELNPRFVKRGEMSRKIKKQVFEMFEYKCMACGKTNKLIVHHDIPVYRGGSDHIDNLRLLCQGCHIKTHQDEYYSWQAMGAQHGKNGKVESNKKNKATDKQEVPL